MSTKTLPRLLPLNSPAKLLGVFDSGHADWIAARAGRIGGSDVGTICGLNKWESPLSLWAKRQGLIPSQRETTEPMFWGTRLESVIMDVFKERHPELKVTEQPGTFVRIDRDWQLANPDGIAINPETGERFVIEIKTARYEDEWREAAGDQPAVIPASYRAQVLWYCQTLGIDKAIVVCLFSGSRYGEFPVAYDEFEASINLEQVEAWREYERSGKQPDYDGAESTYETIRQIHPLIDPDADDVELGELGIQYFAKQDAFDKAEAEFREAKTRVLDAMGTAKRGLIEGTWALTRQARGTGLPYLVNKKG